MDDINLAIWTSYEKIRIFYEKHPGLYKLRIALLLLFTVLFLLSGRIGPWAVFCVLCIALNVYTAITNGVPMTMRTISV